MTRFVRRLVCVIVAIVAPIQAAAFDHQRLTAPWPDPTTFEVARGTWVTFPSRSPFNLVDASNRVRDLDHQAHGWLFMPAAASAAAPVPAVVILHGASGVKTARELTYARQLQAMGVAALVVDAFSSRVERARSFTERLLEITEIMMIADAYAALRMLHEDPRVDGERVALLGFSYGGMAAVFAAYRQVALMLTPVDLRFAGHVSFYAPCIARFDQPRTTGRPLLMLMGAKDEIIDVARCREIRDDLRRGGSTVDMIVYPDAYHQWDGGFRSWRAPRGLADCRLTVEADGDIRDGRTLIPMRGPWTRKIILGLCSDDDGYVIQRSDEVRSRSNQALGRFLAGIFAPEPDERPQG